MRRLFSRSKTLRTATLALAFVSTLAMTNGGMVTQAQEQLAPIQSGSQVGQTTEPVLVVTLGSLNQLVQDINYLTDAVGMPQFGGTFEIMSGMFAQGIDKTQPVGILVPLVDGAPEPIAMLPTADVRAILKQLEAQTGPVDELDDGTLVINVGANVVFIRQVGNWAVLARNRNVLDQAPADPSSLISAMGTDYDLGIRLDMQQVPEPVRDALITQLRQGFNQAMSRQNGQDADSAREYAEQSMDQLEQVISQTDDLMIGLDIDAANRQIVLDASFTAIPGTKLAAIYEGQKPIPSAYSMVIRDDAAAYFHAAASVGPETIEQARSSVKNAVKMAGSALGQIDELSEPEVSEITDMIQRITDLTLKSYEEGKFDAGAVLLTDANQMQFALGSFIADGNEAATIVKDIARKLEGRGDAPRFEFDRDTYKGVVLHLVEKDIPAKADELRKIFGDTVRLHIGTGEKAVYVGLGDASVPLMMEMIDGASGQPQSSGDLLAQFEINMLPILQFAQSIEANDAIISMLDSLSRATDRGTLRVITKAVDNGQSSRIVISDGVIRSIGAAVRDTQRKKAMQSMPR
ncbi:hypothetical protein SAMN06265222_102481 [Neorhodopirellula lusitana]|uniref:Uncharacterized protein n=1 Tax=Neorhodopirellula lusitana TaxID=445327 RepID=A0ABY1PVC5_9BACT|nr:hypothetical protein [Neorhodopirellula lusitana]SMP48928.1 hypothetical protein SAMN06265222_102481 [Neorhodopirellula lusitana]